MRALLFAILAAVCESCHPSPPVPPPDVSGATCAGWCRHAAELGGCGIDPVRCEPDCIDADRSRRQPLGCLAAASTCEAAWSCK